MLGRWPELSPLPARKFPPLCSPPEVSLSCEICRWRKPVLTRVPNPNASEASYKPEQHRGGSVPSGVKNPWGGNYQGRKTREGTQGWKLPGRKGPSTILNITLKKFNFRRSYLQILMLKWAFLLVHKDCISNNIMFKLLHLQFLDLLLQKYSTFKTAIFFWHLRQYFWNLMKFPNF